jgi:uncharacterized protein with NRDE domain
MERVERDAHLYNGFNLLARDNSALLYFSNRERRIRTLTPGIYGLSNHLLDTPWPKVSITKSAFSTLLTGEGTELTGNLFPLLSSRDQAGDHQLPSTGIPLEWERLLSSAFITSAEYGTRSSTVVLVGRDNRIEFVERSFGRDGAMVREVRLELPVAIA